MYQHIALCILWILLFGFSFFAHRIFLSERKVQKRFGFLLFSAAAIWIASISFLLPSFMFRMVPFFSTFIIILTGIIFYKGEIRIKAGITIMIYLIFLISESVSGMMGYFYQFFFTSSEITDNIISAGEPGTVIVYGITFCGILLLICFYILPQMKQYINVLTPTFFFRFTRSFFLIYLISNGMMNLLYVNSLPAFFLMSVIFFVFIGIAARSAIHSFQLFLAQENERTKLILQRDCLEQQEEHSKELAEKYSKIRKQNHDISNHLLVISYLIENKRWNETERYIEKILEKKEMF